EDTTARAVKTRAEVLDTVSTLLMAHERMEEEIFYPGLEGPSQCQGHRAGGLPGAPRRRPARRRASGPRRERRTLGREVQGAEGEHRAPHRGGRRRDVRGGAQGVQRRGARGARRAHGAYEERDANGQPHNASLIQSRPLFVTKPRGTRWSQKPFCGFVI